MGYLIHKFQNSVYLYSTFCLLAMYYNFLLNVNYNSLIIWGLTAQFLLLFLVKNPCLSSSKFCGVVEVVRSLVSLHMMMMSMMDSA